MYHGKKLKKIKNDQAPDIAFILAALQHSTTAWSDEKNEGRSNGPFIPMWAGEEAQLCIMGRGKNWGIMRTAHGPEMPLNLCTFSSSSTT